MPNRSYQKGRGFEYRWLERIKGTGKLVRGERFYASKGITDVWYYLTDKSYHEDQCKYTSIHNNKPYISEEEFLDLIQYAMDNPNIIVSLVSGVSRKEPMVWNLSKNI